MRTFLSREFLAQQDAVRRAIASAINQAEMESDALMAEANWPEACARIEEAKFKGYNTLQYDVRGGYRCTGYVTDKTYRVIDLFAQVAARHGCWVNQVGTGSRVVINWDPCVAASQRRQEDVSDE